jgi:hypothetical protein
LGVLLAILIHRFTFFVFFWVRCQHHRVRRTGRKVLYCFRARGCLGGNLCLNHKLNPRPKLQTPNQTPDPQISSVCVCVRV